MQKQPGQSGQPAINYQHFFQELLEVSTRPILIVDRSLAICFYNQQAVRLLDAAGPLRGVALDTLLADETKEVIKMFGVNGPLGVWVQRVTFLIDQDRMIRGRVKAHFSIGEHEDFIRKAIELRKG